MKKLHFFAMAALCLSLSGLTGCSAGNSADRTPSDSALQRLKNTAKKLPGTAGDLAEILFPEEDSDADSETALAKDSRDEEGADGSSLDEHALDGAELAEDEASDTAPASDEGVLNNGGTVVRIQGNDYYWKYGPDSAAEDGLFARYSFQQDAVNEMVCRHPDGTEEVLFTAAGSDSIYIAGDRMYLNNSGSMYSVNLDGSDRLDYEYFTIWDSNPEAGLVIGSAGAAVGVQVISSETGAAETLAGTENSYPVYAGSAGGFVYYSAADSNTKEFVLYQYNLDGSGNLREVDRFSLTGDLLSSYSGSVYATQISLLDNCLYYSYGFYAGTGGFFQAGGINCVELDESGAPVNHSACVDSISAEEFAVVKLGDDILLHYITEANGSYVGFWDDYPYADCTVKNLTTGQTESSVFHLSRPGSFVFMDGAICTMEDNQAAYKILIPKELVSSLGCIENPGGSEDHLTLIRDLEIVGEDIYFTAEDSLRTPERDMGWRPGYQREGSRRLLLKAGENQAEELFAY